MKPSSIPRGTLKMNFSGLSLTLFGHQIIELLGLDYDVVHIGLNGPPDEFPKVSEHSLLVRHTSIIQSKRHHNIAVRDIRSDE